MDHAGLFRGEPCAEQAVESGESVRMGPVANSVEIPLRRAPSM
jgi:hypothetical protein